ncbi:gamma-interferon-inducible lysosomal thiol reductase-like [Rhipicephalus sanguineus]|uniref:gamma-interferon-inducible lysosomal thiol reductase-like n=1 Tax=Rhipicephalus sanguineus TaxID=34632 RepID=UPI0020C2AA28|nr:gamma-interferon-inducible lysosomal thiol reductase-like [Rhipicephalus sanguineus]
MFEARVLRFRCTLKNPRWSKFTEPSTTASLIIIWWFWDVKPQKKKKSTSINLTLYYEGLCPDCHDFFIDQLWPTYNKLEEYIDVDLVPFGKAHMKVANDTSPSSANTVLKSATSTRCRTCAVKTILLRRGSPAPRKIGTYWPVLDKCSRGPEGEKLFREMGERTLALKPPMKWVPYVQINGAHDDAMESLVEKDLFGFVCKLLEPSAPRDREQRLKAI